LLKGFNLLHINLFPQNAATVVIPLKLAGSTKKGKLDHLLSAQSYVTVAKVVIVAADDFIDNWRKNV